MKTAWLVGLMLLAAAPAFGQTRTYPMTMTWTDNSNNEDGFILYLRATGQTTYTEVGTYQIQYTFVAYTGSISAQAIYLEKAV